MTTKGDVVHLFKTLMDQSWYGIMTDAPTRPTPPPKPTPFTAWADCPKCGEIACHWLDGPHRATRDELEAYQRAMADYQPEYSTLEQWGGEVVQTMRPCNSPPSPPRDETFTVARICVKCGHRWGQV